MMGWYNIGVVCSDSETQENYLQAMRDQGLAPYRYGDAGLHLTSYALEGGLSDRGLEIVKGVAKDDFGEGVEALIIIHIMPDSDEIEGTIYEISDGSCEKYETVQFSDANVCESWRGVSYDGVTVDARRPQFE